MNVVKQKQRDIPAGGCKYLHHLIRCMLRVVTGTSVCPLPCITPFVFALYELQKMGSACIFTIFHTSAFPYICICTCICRYMSAPLPALLRNSEKNFSCAFFHKNARKLCVFLLFVVFVTCVHNAKN